MSDSTAQATSGFPDTLKTLTKGCFGVQRGRRLRDAAGLVMHHICDQLVCLFCTRLKPGSILCVCEAALSVGCWSRCCCCA